MKYLVTGGAGFIGSNLGDRLIDEGHEVVVLDNLYTGNINNINSKALFIEGDIRNIKDVEKAMKGCDGVFHTAALARINPSILSPMESHDVNVNGTLNVLWCAKNSKTVKRFVYSASSSSYKGLVNGVQTEGDPIETKSPYALQKFIGEEYCRLFKELYGLSTVSLRYFNAYGPKMPPTGDYAAVISIFTKQKESGEKLTIFGDGEQRRDFTHVYDVVKANILAMDSNTSGVYNVGSGENFSINTVANMIGGEKKYLPSRPGEYDFTLANISKIKKDLGWEPKVNFINGIKII